MRTLDELTPWLFGRVSGGVRWGLDRTERLLAGVGDPHRHFHSVHIGGTNGKGSVSALCDSVLRAAGDRRIGMYTSPHLVSFTERVRVDGAPIDAGVLADVATRLQPAIEESGATFFEATTAIAFLAFAEAGVELAVVEVGLGGRLDATNVLRPLVTAVTNVSLDHTEYLGETLAGIAAEKAGIFKPGVPAVAGERDPALVAVMAARAAEVGAPFHQLGALTDYRGVEVGIGGSRVEIRSGAWGDRTLAVPLIGPHQARNAVLALETLGLLPADFRPSWAAVERGFAEVRWPGRMQLERRGDVTWLFDVAHNPAGAAALAEGVRGLGLPTPIVAVVGVLGDKDWRAMLRAISPEVAEIILTTAGSAPAGRRWELGDVERWCAEHLGVEVAAVDDLAQALARAVALAPGGTIVVTGSVHTVGDSMAALGISSV